MSMKKIKQIKSENIIPDYLIKKLIKYSSMNKFEFFLYKIIKKIWK